MKSVTLFLIVAALALCANGAPQQDKITHLPGYEGPLPFGAYAGFIEAGTAPDASAGELMYHYVFFEAESDPANKPLCFWSNGGPGAPSMYGLFVELGPLLLNDLSLTTESYKSTGVPTLVDNPYAWTKVCSVLIVDNPPPVGFSYCTVPGQTSNGFACGNWTDTLVATAQYNFFQNWYKEFPEYQNHELYLTGESYAGVYTPMLFQKLLNEPSVKLRGMAVGDGCLGTDVLCGAGDLGLGPPWWDIVFFYGHGQISIDAYEHLLSVCPESELKRPNQSPQCKSMVADVMKAVGYYQGYALYDSCQNNMFDFHATSTKRTYWGPNYLKASQARPSIAYPGMGYYCPGPALDLWLALPEVKAAMHVAPDANFVSGDNGSDMNYILNEKSVLPIWLNAIKNSSTRVMTYNGDTDPSLSSFRTQAVFFPYFRAEGVPATQQWRPWTMDGKSDQRGYVQEWANGKMSYVTIRGSGHMVPEFRGQAMFKVISTFISGQDFPKLNH